MRLSPPFRAASATIRCVCALQIARNESLERSHLHFAAEYKRSHEAEWLAFAAARKASSEAVGVVPMSALSLPLTGAKREDSGTSAGTPLEAVAAAIEAGDDGMPVAGGHGKKRKRAAGATSAAQQTAAPALEGAASSSSESELPSTLATDGGVRFNDLDWPTPLQPARNPVTGSVFDVEVRLFLCGVFGGAGSYSMGGVEVW
jgi:hypothetical protein